jgi:magnesium transporter
MISIYRWQKASKTGSWSEIPSLPEYGKIPDDEIWWVDLEDPSAEEESLVFTKFFPVHALTFEDIVRHRRSPNESPHFPKVEEFPDYLFVVANPMILDDAVLKKNTSRCSHTQLSAVMDRRVLLTHHALKLASVDELKQYLFRHSSQAGRGPDYLFHLILDNMVDEYAPEIDRIAERLDDIETEMFDRPSTTLLSELIRMKRRVAMLRKTLILEREVLARLTRGEFELVEDREIAYYRNVYDHLVRYTELIEAAREMVSDLMQTHLAAVSNKMNGIVKVLTMISTIIMPMTLISGIYGMNFEWMPFLKNDWGFALAVGLMAISACVALAMFYWRRWF